MTSLKNNNLLGKIFTIPVSNKKNESIKVFITFNVVYKFILKRNIRKVYYKTTQYVI